MIRDESNRLYLTGEKTRKEKLKLPEYSDAKFPRKRGSYPIDIALSGNLKKKPEVRVQLPLL